MVDSRILELAQQLAARHNELSAAEFVFRFFGVQTFGIEMVSCAERAADYVNFGETYAQTIVRENDDFSVQSWGGWLEGAECAHCEDNDVIRCAYCGEFTPLCAAALAEPMGERSSWSDTRCEHCGRNVSSGELQADDTGGEFPNLDGFNTSELEAYCAVKSNPRPLREYANYKARAMRARLAGDVSHALKLEEHCENIYNRLPSDMKW